MTISSTGFVVQESHGDGLSKHISRISLLYLRPNADNKDLKAPVLP
jgi:hypothetical protein